MPWSWIAESYGNSVFNFFWNFKTYSKRTHHFTFPPAEYEGSSFSTLDSLIQLFLLNTFSVPDTIFGTGDGVPLLLGSLYSKGLRH